METGRVVDSDRLGHIQSAVIVPEQDNQLQSNVNTDQGIRECMMTFLHCPNTSKQLLDGSYEHRLSGVQDSPLTETSAVILV